MTREEAEAMLVQLAEHYGEPVMPVGRYCEALLMWGELAEKAEILKPGVCRDIELKIQKSNLLYRIIYLGEKLRTRPCPEHEGKWVAVEDPEDPCRYGCGMTGWLPEEGTK